jgi:nicotinamidase-related amidase
MLLDMSQSDSSFPAAIARSPLLMSRAQSALLVVDLQTRLVEAIRRSDHIIWNVGRLVRGAQVLDVPVIATEQYPEKLGPTVDPIAEGIQNVASKLHFSCAACPQLFRSLAEQGRSTLLVAGMETHVCVMQTVLDLLADGFDLYVVVDAVASRFDIDHNTALQRMHAAGATLTTTETALFEWSEVAGTPEFKQISNIVREAAPRNGVQGTGED